MLVLVTGDRRWSDSELIRDRLARLPTGTTVVHGDCVGADRIAGAIATELGFVVRASPAQWSTLGKRAGLVRNREMLDLKPDLVLAFHNNIRRSVGTKDCLTEAKRRGFPWELLSRTASGAIKIERQAQLSFDGTAEQINKALFET